MTITCDNDRCSNKLQLPGDFILELMVHAMRTGPVRIIDLEAKQELGRKLAADVGWTFVNGNDFCPRCSEEVLYG